MSCATSSACTGPPTRPAHEARPFAESGVGSAGFRELVGLGFTRLGFDGSGELLAGLSDTLTPDATGASIELPAEPPGAVEESELCAHVISISEGCDRYPGENVIFVGTSDPFRDSGHLDVPDQPPSEAGAFESNRTQVPPLSPTSYSRIQGSNDVRWASVM